jgi:hypothetical protein
MAVWHMRKNIDTPREYDLVQSWGHARSLVEKRGNITDRK